MSDAFEWFDPYEQKQRAEREERRANGAFADGRRAVEDAIARASRNGLSEKMEMVIGALAEKIARRTVIEVSGQMAFGHIEHEMGTRIAKHFKTAAMEVVKGLELSDVTRMRVRQDARFDSMEETMTVEYETVQPFHVAHRFYL